MSPIEVLLAAVTGVLVLAGLTMVGLALRAYARTTRPALIPFSVGFTLIASAAVATTISAFLLDFEAARSLLAVDAGMTALGYLFVIYGLTVRRLPNRTTADRSVPGESSNTQ